jgi:hypothetical protein
VLKGTLNLACKYVLQEHLPELIDDSTGNLSPKSYQKSKQSFQSAIKLFLQRGTHEKKLRDCQLIYYQPGGTFQVQKDLGTLENNHHHHFDEFLRVVKLLPVGDIAMPNESLALKWFYMTFHKSECNQFIASG